VLTSLLELDAALRGWFASVQTPWLDHVAWALSVAGQAGWIWLLLGLALAAGHPRRFDRFWQLCLAILLAYVAVDLVLKPYFARSRPFDVIADVRVFGARPSTFSFPSGHAASAFAGAFVTSLMVARGAWALWLLAVAITASRVYLGVHYPLDVMGGAITGTAVAAFVTGGRACYSERSAIELASAQGPQGFPDTPVSRPPRVPR
jgi:undecaprenyl-diphosphatase